MQTETAYRRQIRARTFYDWANSAFATTILAAVLPGTRGPRLSFLSVALWWALFSISLLARVPEPGTLTDRGESSGGVAAIYGAELNFGSLELIPTLLLVRFAGIPFSQILGRLPLPPGAPAGPG